MDFNQQHISTNDRVAKKEHFCHVCGGKIEVGETYTIMVERKPGRYYSKHRTYKVCLMHNVSNIKIKNNKLYEV
jgi:hypothetical protein